MGIKEQIIGEIIIGISLVFFSSILRGAASFFSGRWTEKTGQGVAYDLRNKLHRKIHELSFRFHDTSESGQLITRTISDVEAMRFLSSRAILRLGEMGVLVIGFSIAMLMVNWQLALASLSILPFLLPALLLGELVDRPRP